MSGEVVVPPLAGYDATVHLSHGDRMVDNERGEPVVRISANKSIKNGPFPSPLHIVR